ncbi:PREDICTED: uncharacterized protein LOC109181296 [Ipomoea nil]|uniref:uncharacterized protein LOC109181296 n=1 Tax=Ipomoea nil TaxID=35883 RepID=UPI00090086C7|nr:PREDICTED: uncharacterized protein LOC109181296 [Ipomoea nil]
MGSAGDHIPSLVWQSSKEHHSDPPELLDDEGDVGVGGNAFLRALKNLLNIYRPSILSVFEPKVSGAQANEICKKLGFSDWIRVEAVGFSGGIWVFWRDPVEENNQPPWLIASMYGSPTHHLRRRLRKDLRHSERNITGSWTASGDFNAVTSRDETSNYISFSAHRSSDFISWIQEEGLIDLGFSGPHLTWMKNGGDCAPKGARLDRALCNTDWRLRFPGACVTHLARFASDHAPLLLQVQGGKHQPKVAPFVFQAAWLTHADARGVVERISDQSIMDNTRNLAAGLSAWNKSTFGNIFKRKRIFLSRINGIQKVLARTHHRGLEKLEHKLREELEATLHQEELLWYQKSREEWICSGDRNTSFYHAAAAIRKSRTSVRSLVDDTGVWITEETGLKDHIRNFYVHLFSEEGTGTPQISRLYETSTGGVSIDR